MHLKTIDFYKVFARGECIVTSSLTPEIAKLIENSTRDVIIAFADKLTIITE